MRVLVRVYERLLGEDVRACCRMAGEEKFQHFWLSEGIEGEEGSFSSRCGWFEFLHV